MSIRLIAKELYLLQQEMDKIEKKFQESPKSQHSESESTLRKMKAERKRMKSILEGKKSNAATQKRRY